MKRISSSESNNGLEAEEKALVVDGTEETEFCDDDDEDELCGNGGGLPSSCLRKKKLRLGVDQMKAKEFRDDDDEDELCSNSSGGGGLPSSGLGEKKRRLGVDQVKALQNNFEVDNKLDPERKLRLAQDLGLQPRQVAIWFQNRRARWKTKLLERDFSALKVRHDALKLNCDTLRRDNHGLLAQISELKAKLAMTEATEASEDKPPLMYNYKDGASDSDSSCVVFNDEAPKHEHLTGFKSSSFEKELAEHVDEKGGYYQHVDDEELCSSLFSEQPAMNLSTWYSSHQWD